jgi:hypothetical protein
MPDMQESTIIFQWPWFKRFDKIIEDLSWDTIIKNDPVYHFNTVTDSHNRRWWLSSASTVSEVQLYHTQYVQHYQNKNRYRVYRALVDHSAVALKCKILHTRTEDQEKFSQQLRFSILRQTEVQPAPIVHLCWLMEKVLPHISITVDNNRCQKLKQLIDQVQWIPYDVNQDEIWKDICAQL